MGRLDNRTAIVTGAASGMGEATARLLAAEGAKVLAVGRDTSKIHDVLGNVDGIETLGKDVTDPDAGEVIIAKAVDLFGGLDILVNNAGAGSGGNLEDMTDEDWAAGFSINVDSMFRLCRAATPELRKSKAGRIVNIGSLMSLVGGPGMGSYAASKHAVIGLTKTLACELGPDGITVNAVIPGAIHTAMMQGIIDTDPETVAYWDARAPLGRWGTAEDIAPPVLFLASDDAAFVTGASLAVDGGVAASP